MQCFENGVTSKLNQNVEYVYVQISLHIYLDIGEPCNHQIELKI